MTNERRVTGALSPAEIAAHERAKVFGAPPEAPRSLNPPFDPRPMRDPRIEADADGFVSPRVTAYPQTEASARAEAIDRQTRIRDASNQVAATQERYRGTPVGGPSLVSALRELWRRATS